MANAPAISVVIPMYNAEKYIAETLDSVLAQTFQDFEVLVVNDCSTDNCRAVVESYLEKFGGRLKIFDNEKNSGPGATRNNGILCASGEYIFFTDADDMLLADGLERILEVAKNFDVDVVNCTGYYIMSENGKNKKVAYLKKPNEMKESFVESNIEWRVKNLLINNFYWAAWRKLVRRDFLIENKLFFPVEFIRGEDVVWTHGLWFFAKKILHVPLAIYFYRKSENSITRTDRSPLEGINFNINRILYALKWIEAVMARSEFFEQNPRYRCAMFEHIAQRYLGGVIKSIWEVSQEDLYPSIKKEFTKEFGEYCILIPVLFSIISDYRKNLNNDKEKIAELEKLLKQGKKS